MAYRLDRTVIESGLPGVTYIVRSQTDDIDSLYETLGNAEDRAMRRGDSVIKNEACLLILMNEAGTTTIYSILEVF